MDNIREEEDIMELTMHQNSSKVEIMPLTLIIILFFFTDSLYGQNNWRVINKKGDISHIINAAKTVSYFSESLMLVEGNDYVQFLDKDFDVVFFSTEISLSQWASKSNGLIPFYKNGKEGYMDPYGNIVIGPQYDNASSFYNGYAIVGTDNGSQSESEGPVTNPYTFGVIDMEGNFILPMKYFFISLAGIEKGKILVIPDSDLDNNSYIIDINHPNHESKRIEEWGVVKAFPAGLLVRNTKNYGFMDWNGDIVNTKPKFPALWVWSSWPDILYIVNLEDERYVLVDKQGSRIESIDYTHRAFHQVLSENYVAFRDKKTDMMGVLNLSNEIIISPEYEEIWHYNEGIFTARKDTGYGYINELGEEITEFIYDDCQWFSEGYGVAREKK